MKMLPDEQVYLGGQNRGLTVTSHRLRYEDSEEIRSMFLEELTYAEVRFEHQPILLVLAVVVGVGSLIAGVGGMNVAMMLGLVVAAVLVAFYFATKKQALAFTSAGGRISVITTDAAKARAIVDLVEAAKSDRRDGTSTAGQWNAAA